MAAADEDPSFVDIPSTQPATKVVCLIQVVPHSDLKDDKEFEELLEDLRLEAQKFGTVVNVVIPRPRPDGEDVPGIGNVLVEFTDMQGAATAKLALTGRKFSGVSVVAVYYPEDKFASGDYSG